MWVSARWVQVDLLEWKILFFNHQSDLKNIPQSLLIPGVVQRLLSACFRGLQFFHIINIVVITQWGLVRKLKHSIDSMFWKVHFYNLTIVESVPNKVLIRVTSFRMFIAAKLCQRRKIAEPSLLSLKLERSRSKIWLYICFSTLPST